MDRRVPWAERKKPATLVTPATFLVGEHLGEGEQRRRQQRRRSPRTIFLPTKVTAVRLEDARAQEVTPAAAAVL